MHILFLIFIDIKNKPQQFVNILTLNQIFSNKIKTILTTLFALNKQNPNLSTKYTQIENNFKVNFVGIKSTIKSEKEARKTNKDLKLNQKNVYYNVNE